MLLGIVRCVLYDVYCATGNCLPSRGEYDVSIGRGSKCRTPPWPWRRMTDAKNQPRIGQELAEVEAPRWGGLFAVDYRRYWMDPREACICFCQDRVHCSRIRQAFRPPVTWKLEFCYIRTISMRST